MKESYALKFKKELNEKNRIVEFKSASFTSHSIIIKKRRLFSKKEIHITIPLKNVERMFYAKSSFKNQLSLSLGSSLTTGALYIYLKEKVNKRKMYCFFIEYDALLTVHKNTIEMIEFYNENK
jgi:hypothetical protein